MSRRILAVDGGGTKTDVVLLDTDGRVIVQVQGPSSQPQTHGVETALSVLDALVEQVRRLAPAPDGGSRVADHASVYLAGLDLPEEIAVIEAALRARDWAGSLALDNDTFAVLRAGTHAPDAVTVVCGTGINCVGRNAVGEHSRFLALGDISGDWGGGGDLGREALWHAARAQDGRGEPTALARAVPDHFGRPDPLSVAIAIQLGDLDPGELARLAPVVLACSAAGDAVAGRLVDRLAGEMAVLATVSMGRLGLLDRPVDVVLGGGVSRSRDPRLIDGFTARVRAVNAAAEVSVVDAPPVLGAALLGLDALDAHADAIDRVSAALRTTADL